MTHPDPTRNDDTTETTSRKDAYDTPRTLPDDAASSRAGGGGGPSKSQARDGSRDAGPAGSVHATDSHSDHAAHAEGREDEQRSEKGRIGEALRHLVDSIEALVREIPRGAQATYVAAKEKLALAREALTGPKHANPTTGKREASHDDRRPQIGRIEGVRTMPPVAGRSAKSASSGSAGSSSAGRDERTSS